AMMVRHLGDDEAADAIEKSVLDVLAVGELLTPDLGGSASTSAVGDAIAGNLA
ncbi:MAG: tartrate dehydrogenase, partial [Chloroflexi bacterium]|nr:tartrate dehydrogenase [Chloroflexota bacterium]